MLIVRYYTVQDFTTKRISSQWNPFDHVISYFKHEMTNRRLLVLTYLNLIRCGKQVLMAIKFEIFVIGRVSIPACLLG